MPRACVVCPAPGALGHRKVSSACCKSGDAPESPPRPRQRRERRGRHGHSPPPAPPGAARHPWCPGCHDRPVRNRGPLLRHGLGIAGRLHLRAAMLDAASVSQSVSSHRQVRDDVWLSYLVLGGRGVFRVTSKVVLGSDEVFVGGG
ncbi:hypothetical protein NDU88_008200 [Pleurodeles waltl]|uniref:Uncharacterized protein n=1 Tax=Pleurodeles waltl TaxID=8319 RepID=A0AAV7PS70_PLEWA|nr:hypothetical protein NDU88_008200 [Pleurodeles waltl]